jgi:hypothetical protein
MTILIRIEREKPTETQRIPAGPILTNGQFEIGGQGELIQHYPVQGQWVKECITGRVIAKTDAIPHRRTPAPNGFIWYYLQRGTHPPADEDLIPSIWIEGVDYEESAT